MSEKFENSPKQSRSEIKLERERKEEIRIEGERRNVVDRLGISAETTWEEINREFDEDLVLVCRVEGYYGYYVQIPKLRKAYEAALERLKEGKNAVSSERLVQLTEDLLKKYEDTDILDVLGSFTTGEEAYSNEVRQQAVKDRDLIHKRLKDLYNFTDIKTEVYQELYEKWEKLKLAIGYVNGGVVRYDR